MHNEPVPFVQPDSVVFLLPDRIDPIVSLCSQEHNYEGCDTGVRVK